MLRKIIDRICFISAIIIIFVASTAFSQDGKLVESQDINLSDTQLQKIEKRNTLIKEIGLRVEHYIYPFIQTRPLVKDDNKFQGYNIIKEKKQLQSLKRMRKQIGAENRHVLLWVGRPGWRKNLQMLLGAFKELLTQRERKDIILYLHTDPEDPCHDVYGSLRQIRPC